MRIGAFFGRFFVSTSTSILDSSPLWFTLLCSGGALYLMIFHFGDIGLTMLAGYLLLLGVFPSITLTLTAIVLLALLGMYIGVN